MKRKITVEIPERVVNSLDEYARVLRGNGAVDHAGNPVTRAFLLRLGAEAVSMAWERPGSWEGGAMLPMVDANITYEPLKD